MYVSPFNIIRGLHQIVEANREHIDRVIKYYRSEDTLHLFDGLRKTLPLSAYPSLEFDPSSASTEWTHTSAQTGEYAIDCYLTVKNASEDFAAEYISEVARAVLKVFNYPDNMCFRIPNEYYQTDDPSNPRKYPVWIQFGNVANVTYRSSRDGAIQMAQFTWSGRVLEYFQYYWDGPRRVDWKHEILPGSEEDDGEDAPETPPAPWEASGGEPSSSSPAP